MVWVGVIQCHALIENMSKTKEKSKRFDEQMKLV